MILNLSRSIIKNVLRTLYRRNHYRMMKQRMKICMKLKLLEIFQTKKLNLLKIRKKKKFKFTQNLNGFSFRDDGPFVYRAEDITTVQPKITKKRPINRRPATITRRRRIFRKRKKKLDFNFSFMNIFGGIRDFGLQTIYGIDSFFTDILNRTIYAGVKWYEGGSSGFVFIKFIHFFYSKINKHF